MKVLIGFALSLIAMPSLAIDAAAYQRCTAAATNHEHPASWEEAVTACGPSANEGVPGAMYILGELLLKSDMHQALGIQWLRKASDSGHPAATLHLAKLALAKESTRAEGVRLLRLAACSGYGPAVALANEQNVSASMTDCPVRRLRDFTGTWTGELTSLKKTDTKTSIKVTIDGSRVDVSIMSDGAWLPVKPGKFTSTSSGSTLLLSALDSGWDMDGQWNESWTIALLRTSDNEAFVSFTRTVNNPNMPAGLEWRYFTSHNEGTMTRSK